MRLFLLVVVISTLALDAHAVDCVCVKEAHPSEEKIKAERKQEYDKATAVFTGEVVALDGFTVKFRLKKRWKGDNQHEIVMSTGAIPGPDGTPIQEECSYQFRLGEEYLVYAHGAGQKMKAYICTTFLIKDAVEEEKGLDEIKRHETIREKSPK
jgi:hypothetical protein